MGTIKEKLEEKYLAIKKKIERYYEIKRVMTVSAWTGGKGNINKGSGYGIRISRNDVHRYFDVEQPEITIHIIDGPTVNAKLTPSFWNTCTEIRNKEIGKWVLDSPGVVDGTWAYGFPPKYILKPISKTEFELYSLGQWEVKKKAIKRGDA